MLHFLVMLFTLMGFQQELNKPYSLVVNLDWKQTVELIETLEKCENKKLIIDIICEYVKEIHYDHKSRNSTIIFKKSE